MGDFQARKYLDDITAGTAAASKAVVLDSNSKIDTLDITALKLNGNACDEAFLAGASKVALTASVSAAAATSTATTAVLANDLKAKFNALLVALKAAGLQSST